MYSNNNSHLIIISIFIIIFKLVVYHILSAYIQKHYILFFSIMISKILEIVIIKHLKLKARTNYAVLFH